MITQPPGYLWKVIWLHAEGNESHHKELSPANHLSYPPAPPTLTPRVEKTCLQYLKGFSGDRQHGFYVFPKASSELRGTGVTGVNVPSHTSYRQPHRHPKHFWLQSHAQIQLTICADTTESPVENFPPSERFHNYLFTEAYCFSKTPLHTDTLQVICQILNLLVLRWKKKQVRSSAEKLMYAANLLWPIHCQTCHQLIFFFFSCTLFFSTLQEYWRTICVSCLILSSPSTCMRLCWSPWRRGLSGSELGAVRMTRQTRSTPSACWTACRRWKGWGRWTSPCCLSQPPYWRRLLLKCLWNIWYDSTYDLIFKAQRDINSCSKKHIYPLLHWQSRFVQCSSAPASGTTPTTNHNNNMSYLPVFVLPLHVCMCVYIRWHCGGFWTTSN